ncbi:TIGR00725 family protein [Pseudochelatococcus sp. B33]
MAGTTQNRTMSITDGDVPSLPLAWSGGVSRLFRSGDVARRGVERFDPWHLRWTAQAEPPGDLTPVAGLGQALRLIFTAAGARRVPVGVIGPREASGDECALAEAVGRTLAEHGLQLICGGMGGVMEAACKGHLEAGGAPIGLLPDTEWRSGNPYVAIPIATGIGPVRNAILARASVALVAIGGGYGTLTEMAYGLHFDRPVLTLGKTPFVEGAEVCATPAEVIARVARHLLDGTPAPAAP